MSNLPKKIITDRQGNEVLPITHVSAVYDDSGTPVSTLIANAAEEASKSYVPTLDAAPGSGTTTYTRDGATKDFVLGQFCRVAGSGGYDFYQLTDLTLENSTPVATWQKVTKSDSVSCVTIPSTPTSTTTSYTKDGETIDFRVGDEVRVAAENASEDSNGYVFYKLCDLTDNQGTKTAYWDLISNVKGYVTVNTSSNQGTDETIAAVSPSIRIGYAEAVTYSAPVQVAPDTPVVVTWPDVAGYKTPTQQTFIKSGTSNESKSGTYQTEVVTVTVGTDEQGVSAEGQKITINGTEYTVPSTGLVTAKVPFDTIYSISADNWNGQTEYTAPESQNNITANASTRNITMTYLKVRTKTYNLVITDDQNGNHTSDAEVTVKYTIEGVETELGVYENGDTFTVPIEATVNLVPSAIEDAVPTIVLNNNTYTVTYRILAVDMGNSIKWAAGNLTKDINNNYGIASPTEYGAYFSWGNIVGHNVEGQNEDYKFSESNYNNTNGSSISSSFTSGDENYDAARANLGGNWRIPTRDEFKWLIANCTYEFVTNYENSGVNGALFTSNINGNTLFFPAAGYGHSNGMGNIGSSGEYATPNKWTSDGRHYQLGISSSAITADANTSNISGTSIRPVRGEIISSYIINQTDPTASPEDFIEIDTPAMNSNDIDSVIHRIHSNSKLYGAEISLSNDKLQVKEISRANKGLFADGSTVDKSKTDIYMKLPEFWYKVAYVSANVYRVSFTMTDPNDGSWEYWDGKTFIGVYKATYQHISDKNIYSFGSMSGFAPDTNRTHNQFKNSSRSKGTGFQLVTYDVHRIMCFLGCGWAGTTKLQDVIGVGSSKKRKTTGLCDLKGFNDTIIDVDGGSPTNFTDGDISVNFWGLENWIGDLIELMDDIYCKGTTGNISIRDIDGNEIRYINPPVKQSRGCITKLYLSSYKGDVILSEVNTNWVYNKGFASDGYITKTSGNVYQRAGGDLTYGAGLFYLDSHPVTEYYDTMGTRIIYHGDYDIVSSLYND